MFERLHEQIRVCDIAGAMGSSEFHFARIFKKETGHAPHAYLTLLRLAYAKLLLTTTSVPLAEIARRTGFKTQAHFTGVFSRRVGTTPSKYRKSHAMQAADGDQVMMQRIDLADDHERMIWARVLQITEERLASLVAEHGSDPNAVRAALKRAEIARSGARCLNAPRSPLP